MPKRFLLGLPPTLRLSFPQVMKMKISPIQGWREKQRISQRCLAEKAGISRGRLRRLEQEQFETATFGELKRISSALGIDIRDIFAHEGQVEPTHLGRAGQNAFQLDAGGEGYKISSFLPARPDLFVGKLFLAAEKRMSFVQLQKRSVIFLQVFVGTVRVELEEGCYEIREGDHLLFRGDASYAIQNPLRRESTALVITLPGLPL